MTDKERDALLLEIRTDVAVLVAQNDDQRQTLYGNGQPGLCARFAKVEQAQIDCQAKNGKAPARRANLIACAALVLMALTLALNIAGVI
jgi:hypothetical protein